MRCARMQIATYGPWHPLTPRELNNPHKKKVTEREAAKKKAECNGETFGLALLQERN